MVDRIKRIPELRFSNFYNEWQEKKLGDLGKTYTGLSGKTKNDFGFGDSHFITYMNVFKNNIAKFEMTEKVKISNNENQNKVNYGDIFFTTSSEVPQEVGMTSIWLFKTNNVYLNSFCFGFRITINNVLPIFLARYLRSENIRKKITILAQGSTRFNLSKKEVMKLSINFPEINEQQKIGDFFSKLDRQIELEEKKLELLEQQKHGYMQKFFSQELRFKDEEGNYYKEWDTKQLKDVLEFSNKRTTNENEYPVLTSSRKGLILQSDYYKDGKTFAESNIGYFILPKNYITYRSRSDDGIFKFNLNQIIDVGIISKYYPVFKGINTNQYYLTLHLNYRLKKEYIKYAIGTSQLVLSQKNLQNIQTKLPSYEEQTKIANFLSKLDKLIEKQSDKVELLKERKKGFLQKMFV